LRPEQWSKLLPPPPVEPGHSWELDRDVSAKILTYFYPQTENAKALAAMYSTPRESFTAQR